MKKATIKDIAKAAGVSIATVSYILNDVKTQSISDETRVKVMKAAQQLKYVANRTAQSLKIKKTGLIGILLFQEQEDHYWSDFKYAKTVGKIEQICGQLGYHVIFMQVRSQLSDYKMIMERNLDGVFLINADQERFGTISNYFGFGIPVFVIDSYIDDSLFHKIIPDFAQSFRACEAALDGRPEFLVTDAYNNAKLAGFIREQSGLEDERICVYDNPEQLNDFLSRFEGKPGIVINEFLALEVLKTTARIAAVCTCHCPQVLPGTVGRITFDLNDYQEIVHKMDRYIQDADYVDPEKFYYLSGTP
ncbi:LacI family DNA-binding transcriptional regulator [Paenibacillus chitinolyticus]|uniref:LacI family DNA-binding transcriptional regulator n=1 Tax=Paenibacillus chitinolyticus TaxID=79263 RepID=UPI003CFDB2F4